MSPKQLSLITFIASLLLILTACSPKKEESKASDKLKVVTTYSIIADIAENIGKDYIDVYSMVPRGTDPHQYDPKPNDTQAVEKADLVFYNGLNLETGKGWFDKLVKNSRKEDSTFMVSQGVSPIYLNEKGKESEEDPHAWLNLENGIIYAKNIEQQLSKKDPVNKDFYKHNLDKYVKKLSDLDQQAKSKFSLIPENEKMIVTSEGCFKYFSKAYNIPSAYIWEINTEEEGTPDQIKNLVRKLRATELKSLFVESSVDNRPMKTVSKDTGIPIYSTIFTDSVAKKGENGDSYYSMMKWNLDQIYKGLAK